MIPHYVYDQLARVELLWLYVMLHYVWPSRGTVSPPPPVQPVPPLVKRKRANELPPWALYGLAAAAVRKPTVRTWGAPCEP